MLLICSDSPCLLRYFKKCQKRSYPGLVALQIRISLVSTATICRCRASWFRVASNEVDGYFHLWHFLNISETQTKGIKQTHQKFLFGKSSYFGAAWL